MWPGTGRHQEEERGGKKLKGKGCEKVGDTRHF
jgi:hypothetical protein